MVIPFTQYYHERGVSESRQRSWGTPGEGGAPIWAHAHLHALGLGIAAATVVLVAGALLPEDNGSSSPPRGSPRAFDADSWWNTPLPDEVPVEPAGEEILHYLRTGYESGPGCVMLAGAGDSNWGQPVYDAVPSDPEYDIKGLGQPLPELERLRIPEGAQAAQNSDNSMSVYDREKGYVAALTGAEYDAQRDVWSAHGGTVTYLDSNGLHVDTGRSDDDRNQGSHRGNNGATMAVEIDEVESGVIRHVLKVAAGPEVSDQFVFPMVGSDGDYRGSDPGVPPQGLRFRIKPSIDLDELGLPSQALVIARALQDYGFYIGDSGGTTALKLQNTRASGLGQLWSVDADDLCDLPLTPDYWDVVAGDYDPTTTEAGR